MPYRSDMQPACYGVMGRKTGLERLSACRCERVGLIQSPVRTPVGHTTSAVHLYERTPSAVPFNPFNLNKGSLPFRARQGSSMSHRRAVFAAMCRTCLRAACAAGSRRLYRRERSPPADKRPREPSTRERNSVSLLSEAERRVLEPDLLLAVVRLPTIDLPSVPIPTREVSTQKQNASVSCPISASDAAPIIRVRN